MRGDLIRGVLIRGDPIRGVLIKGDLIREVLKRGGSYKGHSHWSTKECCQPAH